MKKSEYIAAGATRAQTKPGQAGLPHIWGFLMRLAEQVDALEQGQVAPPVEPDPAPNGKQDVKQAMLNEGHQRRIAAGLVAESAPAPVAPPVAPTPAPAPAPAPVAVEAPATPVLASPLD